MTRKDYTAIAKAVQGLVTDEVVDNLCKVFAADNPRFDEDRFKEACK